MPEGLRTSLMWILGVAIAAFILLVMVIIFGNLQGNVGFTQESSSFSNETILLSDVAATPAGASGSVNGALSAITMTNATGGEVIAAGNYTVSGVTFVNATDTYGGTNVNVTYTLTADSQGLIDSNSIILNYTESATNTSAQFPTVGTIIGIVILLAILIGLLVFVIVKMMGVAGKTGAAGGSSNFSGGSQGFG